MSFIRKLLLIAPIIILSMMLIFIDYSVAYFKETVYRFVYNTNVGSIRRFSNEINTIISDDFDFEKYGTFSTNLIHVYNKAIGEKNSIITFLLGEDGTIYHSNDYNQAFLSAFLFEPNNIERVKSVITLEDSQVLYLDNGDEKVELFCQPISDGRDMYYLFFNLDRPRIESELNVNEIIIPICAISLLLLIATEYALFLKISLTICEPQKKGGDSGGD